MVEQIRLTPELIANWKPKVTEEVSDRDCPRLLLRGGKSGKKSWSYWRQVGKRRLRVKIGYFPAVSLKEARDKVLRAREAAQTEVTGAPVTVAALADSYRKDVLDPARETADETWHAIQLGILDACPVPGRPPLGEWNARDVRPADLAALVRLAKERVTVDLIRKDGKVRKQPRGGPGTARVVLREVRSVFDHAVATGLLDGSPAVSLRAKSFGIAPASRDRWLDREELAAFFQVLDLDALVAGTAKAARLPAVTRLALGLQVYTAQRSHSLLGAEWSEVDLEAGTWTIPVARLKLRKRDRAVARPWVVPLCQGAIAILKALRRLPGASPWVVPSPHDPGLHVNPSALIGALRRLQKSGRLAFGSPFTVHDLRRTWRTWARELGIDSETGERCLGHAGADGVAAVYARGPMVERRAQAHEQVGAFFDSIRQGSKAVVVPLSRAR